MSIPEIKRGLQALLAKPGNGRCADCTEKRPSWASINIGVFICLNCAGAHRGLGVHISQVRSVNLDKWKPEQFSLFKNQGGNSSVNAVYEATLPAGRKPTPNSSCERFIRDKYERKLFYKEKSKRKSRKKAAASSSEEGSSSEDSSSEDEDEAARRRAKRKAAAKKKKKKLAEAAASGYKSASEHKSVARLKSPGGERLSHSQPVTPQPHSASASASASASGAAAAAASGIAGGMLDDFFATAPSSVPDRPHSVPVAHSASGFDDFDQAFASASPSMSSSSGGAAAAPAAPVFDPLSDFFTASSSTPVAMPAASTSHAASAAHHASVAASAPPTGSAVNPLEQLMGATRAQHAPPSAHSSSNGTANAGGGGSLFGRRAPPPWNHGASSIAGALATLVDNPSVADVVFEVGPAREQVFAVRAVLATRSPVLAHKFFPHTHGGAAAATGERVTVQLPAFSASAFRAVLHWICTDQLNAGASDMPAVMQIAQALQLPALLSRAHPTNPMARLMAGR